MTGLGSINVSFDTRDARRWLGQYRQWSQRAASHAQRVVAHELLRDAALYTPVLTGALRDSGRVEDVPTFDQSVMAVRVVFGSFEVIYARIQHEKPFNHPSLGFYGAAKFLERPLLHNYAFYQQLFLVEYELAMRQISN